MESQNTMAFTAVSGRNNITELCMLCNVSYVNIRFDHVGIDPNTLRQTPECFSPAPLHCILSWFGSTLMNQCIRVS